MEKFEIVSFNAGIEHCISKYKRPIAAFFLMRDKKQPRANMCGAAEKISLMHIFILHIVRR